ncbi:signal peptidase I [Arenimonas composti]|nr:signal peptidase I [Arenimonas composti]
MSNLFANLDFDIAALLVALAAFTGLVWAIDALFFAKKRRLMQAEGEEVSEPVVVDYSRSLFPIIFAVLILRSFLAEPFRIPSISMMPTLLVGDFILVNKFAYGIRLPVLNTKIIEVGEPQRGDVVVFRYPGNPRIPNDPAAGQDFIKRVVGLPGDRIEFRDQTLFLNGVAVHKEALPDAYVGAGGQGRQMTGATEFVVQLGDVSHHSLEMNRQSILNGSWEVPAGHYFMMGDNRDNSDDSRAWGFVPEENLVGKAFLIWLNCEDVTSACRQAFDYTRIGDTIR